MRKRQVLINKPLFANVCLVEVVDKRLSRTLAH